MLDSEHPLLPLHPGTGRLHVPDRHGRIAGRGDGRRGRGARGAPALGRRDDERRRLLLSLATTVGRAPRPPHGPPASPHTRLAEHPGANMRRLGYLVRFPGSFWPPAILVLASIVLFPTVYLVYLSLRHWVITRPNQYFNGFDNFRRVLGSSHVLGLPRRHGRLPGRHRRGDARAGHGARRRPQPHLPGSRDRAGARGAAAAHPARGGRFHLALPAQPRDRHARLVDPAGARGGREHARRPQPGHGLDRHRRRVEPDVVHVPDPHRGAAGDPRQPLRSRAHRRGVAGCRSSSSSRCRCWCPR